MSFEGDLLEMSAGERWFVPSKIFTEAPIAGREARGVYLAPTANATFTVVNGSGDVVTVRVGGQTYPFIVSTNATGTGYSAIYLY